MIELLKNNLESYMNKNIEKIFKKYYYYYFLYNFNDL
jgi:hypothetical protein